MNTIRRIEASVYLAMGLIVPPVFCLSQRHPHELDIWGAGIFGATLLYCAALRISRGWVHIVLVALGVIAAFAFAAVIALFVAASRAGIGPHWGWI